MPTQPDRVSPARSRLWAQVALLPLLGLRGLVMALVYVIASPLALLVDLVSPRRRLAAGWVVGFMLLALLSTIAAWSVAHLGEEPEITWAGGIVQTYYQVRDNLGNLPHGDLIGLYAARNDLDPALLAAMVQRESNFDPNAVSRAGARGLMQILPSTWRYLYPESSCDGEHAPPSRGPDCIFEPAANLRVGAMYFRSLLQEFGGDVVLAAAAYNAGASAVRRLGETQPTGIPPFRETRQYVRDVLGWWIDLREDSGEVATIRELDRARKIRSLAPIVCTATWTLFCLWTLRRLPWTLEYGSSRSIRRPPA